MDHDNDAVPGHPHVGLDQALRQYLQGAPEGFKSVLRELARGPAVRRWREAGEKKI
jgi:hypothetical protein